jgi:hypothetical protein
MLNLLDFLDRTQVLMLLFSSCDYFACYRFIVINDTNHKLVIKTSTKIYDNGFFFSDSIHLIKQGEKIEFIQNLGLCNKHYIPEDSYILEDTIPKTSKFDIYVNEKLERTLNLRLIWEYESKTQEGIYTLHVTPKILEEESETR